MQKKLENIIIRTATIIMMVIPLWYAFVFLQPIVTTYIFIALTLWILLMELPKLASPKTASYYALALFYIMIPLWLTIGLNQHPLLRIFLFSAIFWVFLNDTGAYLVGTFLGRHKMAPSISPNKTWEGLAGGFLTLVLWNTFSITNFQPELFLSSENIFFVGLSLTFCALATLGDLFESWLKRRAGVKDSGKLLPGHGGILDRIDSLLFVIPAVSIYAIYTLQSSLTKASFIEGLQILLLFK